MSCGVSNWKNSSHRSTILSKPQSHQLGKYNEAVNIELDTWDHASQHLDVVVHLYFTKGLFWTFISSHHHYFQITIFLLTGFGRTLYSRTQFDLPSFFHGQHLISYKKTPMIQTCNCPQRKMAKNERKSLRDNRLGHTRHCRVICNTVLCMEKQT